VHNHNNNISTGNSLIKSVDNKGYKLTSASRGVKSYKQKRRAGKSTTNKQKSKITDFSNNCNVEKNLQKSI